MPMLSKIYYKIFEFVILGIMLALFGLYVIWFILCKTAIAMGEEQPHIPHNKREELVARYFFVICGKKVSMFFLHT